MDDVERQELLAVRQRVPVSKVDQHPLYVPAARVRDDVRPVEACPDVRVEP